MNHKGVIAFPKAKRIIFTNDFGESAVYIHSLTHAQFKGAVFDTETVKSNIFMSTQNGT